MKKKTAPRKLQLRKDTLLVLGEDSMSRAVGGNTVDVTCGCTEDAVCVATTVSPDCVHNESVGCPTTFTPTFP